MRTFVFLFFSCLVCCSNASLVIGRYANEDGSCPYGFVEYMGVPCNGIPTPCNVTLMKEGPKFMKSCEVIHPFVDISEEHRTEVLYTLYDEQKDIAHCTAKEKDALCGKGASMCYVVKAVKFSKIVRTPLRRACECLPEAIKEVSIQGDVYCELAHPKPVHVTEPRKRRACTLPETLEYCGHISMAIVPNAAIPEHHWTLTTCAWDMKRNEPDYLTCPGRYNLRNCTEAEFISHCRLRYSHPVSCQMACSRDDPSRCRLFTDTCAHMRNATKEEKMTHCTEDADDLHHVMFVSPGTMSIGTNVHRNCSFHPHHHIDREHDIHMRIRRNDMSGFHVVSRNDVNANMTVLDAPANDTTVYPQLRVYDGAMAIERFGMYTLNATVLCVDYETCAVRQLFCFSPYLPYKGLCNSSYFQYVSTDPLDIEACGPYTVSVLVNSLDSNTTSDLSTCVCKQGFYEGRRFKCENFYYTRPCTQNETFFYSQHSPICPIPYGCLVECYVDDSGREICIRHATHACLDTYYPTVCNPYDALTVCGSSIYYTCSGECAISSELTFPIKCKPEGLTCTRTDGEVFSYLDSTPNNSSTIHRKVISGVSRTLSVSCSPTEVTSLCGSYGIGCTKRCPDGQPDCVIQPTDFASRDCTCSSPYKDDYTTYSSSNGFCFEGFIGDTCNIQQSCGPFTAYSMHAIAEDGSVVEQCFCSSDSGDTPAGPCTGYARQCSTIESATACPAIRHTRLCIIGGNCQNTEQGSCTAYCTPDGYCFADPTRCVPVSNLPTQFTAYRQCSAQEAVFYCGEAGTGCNILSNAFIPGSCTCDTTYGFYDQTNSIVPGKPCVYFGHQHECNDEEQGRCGYLGVGGCTVRILWDNHDCFSSVSTGTLYDPNAYLSHYSNIPTFHLRSVYRAYDGLYRHSDYISVAVTQVDNVDSTKSLFHFTPLGMQSTPSDFTLRNQGQEYSGAPFMIPDTTVYNPALCASTTSRRFVECTCSDPHDPSNYYMLTDFDKTGYNSFPWVSIAHTLHDPVTLQPNQLAYPVSWRSSSVYPANIACDGNYVALQQDYGVIPIYDINPSVSLTGASGFTQCFSANRACSGLYDSYGIFDTMETLSTVDGHVQGSGAYIMSSDPAQFSVNDATFTADICASAMRFCFYTRKSYPNLLPCNGLGRVNNEYRIPSTDIQSDFYDLAPFAVLHAFDPSGVGTSAAFDRTAVCLYATNQFPYPFLMYESHCAWNYDITDVYDASSCNWATSRCHATYPVVDIIESNPPNRCNPTYSYADPYSCDAYYTPIGKIVERHRVIDGGNPAAVLVDNNCYPGSQGGILKLRCSFSTDSSLLSKGYGTTSSWLGFTMTYPMGVTGPHTQTCTASAYMSATAAQVCQGSFNGDVPYQSTYNPVTAPVKPESYHLLAFGGYIPYSASNIDTGKVKAVLGSTYSPAVCTCLSDLSGSACHIMGQSAKLDFKPFGILNTQFPAGKPFAYSYSFTGDTSGIYNTAPLGSTNYLTSPCGHGYFNFYANPPTCVCFRYYSLDPIIGLCTVRSSIIDANGTICSGFGAGSGTSGCTWCDAYHMNGPLGLCEIPRSTTCPKFDFASNTLFAFQIGSSQFAGNPAPVCAGHGDCDGTGTCICQNDFNWYWDGTACQNPHLTYPCIHGTVVSDPNQGPHGLMCKCDSSNQWSGKSCDVYMCPVVNGLVCNGKGTCSCSAPGECKCTCPTKYDYPPNIWTGCGCEYDVVSSCVQPGTGVICSGDLSGGSLVQNYDIVTTSSNNEPPAFGDCVPYYPARNGAIYTGLAYECSCATNLYSTYCELSRCNAPLGYPNAPPSACNGQRCVCSSVSNCSCSCDNSRSLADYNFPTVVTKGDPLLVGTYCETDVSQWCGYIYNGQKFICNNHGSCQFNSGTQTYSCVCATGYRGDRCQVTDCPSDCGPYGTCTIIGLSSACVCGSQFKYKNSYGGPCNIPNCPGSSVPSANGTVCVCPNNPLFVPPTCTSLPCPVYQGKTCGPAILTDSLGVANNGQAGTCSSAGVCQCISSAYIYDASNNVCRSTCDITHTKSYIRSLAAGAPVSCVCQTGYQSFSNCQNPICSNGGLFSTKFTCVCPPIYSGTYCQTSLCAQGNATSNGLSCSCFSGFTGLLCNKRICHNGGSPGINTLDPCICPPLFTGTFCDVRVPNPCLHNGSLDVNAHCVCPTDWSGSLCQNNICVNGLRDSITHLCVCNDPQWGISPVTGYCTIDLCGVYGNPDGQGGCTCQDPASFNSSALLNRCELPCGDGSTWDSLSQTCICQPFFTGQLCDNYLQPNYTYTDNNVSSPSNTSTSVSNTTFTTPRNNGTTNGTNTTVPLPLPLPLPLPIPTLFLTPRNIGILVAFIFIFTSAVLFLYLHYFGHSYLSGSASKLSSIKSQLSQLQKAVKSLERRAN